MKKTLLLTLFFSVGFTFFTSCKEKDAKLVKENQPWSVRMAQSEIIRNPDPSHLDFVTSKKWNYTNGLVCEAIMKLYVKTGDEQYLDYARLYADSMINQQGQIYGYRMTNYNIDHVNPGKYLFRLYDQIPEERYKIAIDTLRKQLESQPRTTDGGFWHKKVYPYQMWLDGIYMGDVFYAEYVNRYETPAGFADVIHQYTTVAKHTYDPSTGLYKHAWNEDRAQKWADPVTGQSPHVWGRALGWYMMALVDALDYIPENTEGRESMIEILRSLSENLVKFQDDETGGWYQVIDLSGEHGNYIETTCTTMFSYSLLKAARLGYIDPKFAEYGKKAFNGLIDHFIVMDQDGVISLTNCCAVAGLGGNPYRDGSYEYYISEPVRDNDPKGIGPFILAAMEMEAL